MPLSNSQKQKVLQFAGTRAKLQGFDLQKPEGFQSLLIDVVEQIVDQFPPADVVAAYQAIKASTNAALIADLQAQKAQLVTADGQLDAEIADIEAEG